MPDLLYPGASTYPGANTYPGALLQRPTPSGSGNSPTDVFRVFAYDINTNSLICEVPARGLKFDRRLNDAGSIDFTLNLLDPRSAAQLNPLLPYFGQAPFALYIDRDGTLVWGGWAKTSHYTHSAAGAFPVQGKEWLDYFNQRIVVADYSATTYPQGIDPAALVAKAVTDCQNTALAGPGASVRISVIGGSSSLPPSVPAYTPTSFVGQVIADATAGVSPGAGGLDVWMDTSYDPNGNPATTMRLRSPRAGRIAGTTGTGLIFDLLAADDFTWPTDIGPACTTIIEIGGGSGVTAPRAVQQVPGVAVGGRGQPPRLDKVVQHMGVLDRAGLERLAYGEAQQFAPPVVTPTVTIRTADRTTPLGTWIPGDDARLRAAPVERFPQGIDAFWRIVHYEVTVPDDGVPTVTLTFNPPPTY